MTVTDNMPLRDVLIELAREAKVNLELDPRIEGSVIFSAQNQPFDKVLQRICALAGLRATQEGDFVRVELDEPYQQTYAARLSEPCASNDQRDLDRHQRVRCQCHQRPGGQRQQRQR